MRPLIIAALLGALLAAQAVASPAWAADAAGTETIIMLRHGEKPAADLGQLTCQGLNRALALPGVIAKRFGRPAAIFAPNPQPPTGEGDKAYSYVRPLATIEPTAIGLGLPIDASIGFADIGALQSRLEDPALHGDVVLVGWEHKQIVLLAQHLLAAHGGNPASVPRWSGSDFDSIYIVHLTWTGAEATASFEMRREGLNGQPTACPG